MTTKRRKSKRKSRGSGATRTTAAPAARAPIQQAPNTLVVGTAGYPTISRPFLVERIVTRSEAHWEYLVRAEELDARFERARTVLRDWLPQVRSSRSFGNGNITGASVRLRTKCGEIVSPLQVVIAINVARKYEEPELRERGYESIPKLIGGIPVKVIEGAFSLMSPGRIIEGQLISAGTGAPTDPPGFDLPLVGGTPIASSTDPSNFGTLGAVFMTDNEGPVCLTNSHVISKGQCVQLGDSDGQLVARPIGEVLKAVDGNVGPQGNERSVDCAAIRIDTAVATRLGAPLSIRGLSERGVPFYVAGRPIKAIDAGLPIWKFGAGSGRSLVGQLGDTGIDFIRIGERDYFNVFSVRQFSGNNTFIAPGDSGCLLAFKATVHDADAFVLFGMAFAQLVGDDSVAFGCMLDDVIRALDIGIRAEPAAPDWS